MIVKEEIKMVVVVPSLRQVCQGSIEWPLLEVDLGYFLVRDIL